MRWIQKVERLRDVRGEDLGNLYRITYADGSIKKIDAEGRPGIFRQLIECFYKEACDQRVRSIITG